MRIPSGVRAATPLVAVNGSARAHSDSPPCHRAASGVGVGGLRGSLKASWSHADTNHFGAGPGRSRAHGGAAREAREPGQRDVAADRERGRPVCQLFLDLDGIPVLQARVGVEDDRVPALKPLQIRTWLPTSSPRARGSGTRPRPRGGEGLLAPHEQGLERDLQAASPGQPQGHLHVGRRPGNARQGCPGPLPPAWCGSERPGPPPRG